MTDKEIDKLNLGRTLRIAMPAMLAVYNNKRDSAISRLVMAYKSGDKLEPITAEISVYTDLISDLTRRAKETEQLELRAHTI